MTKFRPCIDLHSGQVKQIVGGTLTSSATDLKINHVSEHSAGYFAQLYKDHGLNGGHVIMLGPGNDEAALDALNAWPQGLQLGGGINETNAMQWVHWGAEKVIVTSYLFQEGQFSQGHLDGLVAAVGQDRSKLVIDLSCRKKGSSWVVAINKWQTLTDFEINAENLKFLESYCSEFLIHAADNEGLQQGIDEELVRNLAQWCSIPVTYAGGGKHLADLDKVKELSRGKVDLTIGSALNIFGGSLVTFEECVAWNKKQA